MIAGELANLAGEAYAAVGQQYLRFAETAWIEQHLAGCREARLVLGGHAHVGLAQRNPNRLTAPADVDNLLHIRQELLEDGAGLRGELRLETRLKFEWPRHNTKVAHQVPFSSR